jgi:hypothetical protein
MSDKPIKPIKTVILALLLVVNLLTFSIALLLMTKFKTIRNYTYTKERCSIF